MLQLPPPLIVIGPVPVRPPVIVAVLPEGAEIVPPDEVIVNGWDVFAPEVSVSVPPSNTGLVVTPMLDKPNEPLVTMLVKAAGVGVGDEPLPLPLPLPPPPLPPPPPPPPPPGVVTIRSQIVGDPPSGDNVQFNPLSVPVTVPPSWFASRFVDVTPLNTAV